MKKGIKIAISGRSGCGNTTVTQLVSQKMELKMINYTFHTMADEKGIDFDEFCRMAETNPEFDYELDKKQLDLASHGDCVLGSRLAVWLLKDADLKVFLTAPPEVRAERIHNREGGSIEKQMAKTSARDERDHLRYQRLYEIDNNRYDFCDLVIDTSKMDQFEVAQMVIDAAEAIEG